MYFSPEPGADRSRDVRQRMRRANGADIYVVRVTKHGLGCAKPCWRCIAWCRWAGVRRVFHWDEAAKTFLCVKVNSPTGDSQVDNSSLAVLA